MKYRFVVKQYEVYEERDFVLSNRYRTFICVENMETGIFLPHPITNFIRVNYENRSLSINTLKKYAEEIKKFLNYLLSSIENSIPLFLELEKEGLSIIKLEHGAAYLDHLAYKVRKGQIKSNSVHIAERILTKFYIWMSEQKIISLKLSERVEKKYIRGKIETLPVSPFKDLDLDVTFPRKERNSIVRNRRLHDFGVGRIDLINLFLMTAEIFEPEIAFGIALQFYGGLRAGEVINLFVDSVQVPKDRLNSPIILKIEDNWEEIFKGYNAINDLQVKNPRNQIVFNTEIVDMLYKKHMKMVGDKIKKGKQQPLFIHKNNKPITGQTYRNKFNIVKRNFLKIISSQNIEDYEFLISKPWATHMGRGIFTNLLTFYLGWNSSEVAIARGDVNINSSLAYIEEQNVKSLVSEGIERLSIVAKEKHFNYTIDDIREVNLNND